MSTTIETKSSASIRIDTALLEGICQGLREDKGGSIESKIRRRTFR